MNGAHKRCCVVLNCTWRHVACEDSLMKSMKHIALSKRENAWSQASGWRADVAIGAREAPGVSCRMQFRCAPCSSSRTSPTADLLPAVGMPCTCLSRGHEEVKGHIGFIDRRVKGAR